MRQFFLIFIFCFFKVCTANAIDYDKEVQEKNKNLKHPDDFICPSLDIKFEIVPKYGVPKIDYSLSKFEINNLASANTAKTESPLRSITDNHLVVHGLIEIVDAGRILLPQKIANFSFYYDDKIYKKSCLIVEKIIYETGAKDMLIRIPNDFNNNKCVREEVLKHELNHVKIYRQTLSKYSKITYQQGIKELKNFKRPIARSSEEEAKKDYDIVYKRIYSIIDKNTKLMNEESLKLNRQFDVDDFKKDILKTKCGFVDEQPITKNKKRRKK
ncbi:MAG: hypothetical protein BWY78_00310 [Alphaproteobacteria bacterium ADurb.Bin438]|nr:MAG: hypothetical protein BWY78_00310 [Alphaproteobacteria bacterium ADurb.Bin438]